MPATRWERKAQYGTLLSRVSGVFSLTASGPDGPVCNGSQKSTSEYTLESGYLAWRSGGLFPQLGENAIELSGGNQNYQVFDGLLFWDGGQDCAGRGGNWLSARKAFRETGILRINTKNFTLEGVHLKYNDQPNTHTRLGAARIEYVTDDSFLEHLKLGVMYFNIYDSETETRDGMDGIYLYTEANPLRVLPDLQHQGVLRPREQLRTPARSSSAYGVVRRRRLTSSRSCPGRPSSATATRRSAAAPRRPSTPSSRVFPIGATGSRESCSASTSSPTAT